MSGRIRKFHECTRCRTGIIEILDDNDDGICKKCGNHYSRYFSEYFYDQIHYIAEALDKYLEVRKTKRAEEIDFPTDIISTINYNVNLDKERKYFWDKQVHK